MFKCEKCGKEFSAQEGLDQHNMDKHGPSKHERKEMKKQQKQEEKTVENKHAKNRKMKRYALLVVAVVALVGIVYAVISIQPAPYIPVTVDGDNLLGSEDAPVTIIEFSDFECPFCARFATETAPSIIQEYVENGTAKLIFKHFPLPSHPYAQKAAEATECAGDQGKFWEMHDKLFENPNNLFVPALKNYAEELGLDAEQFNSCLDSGVMADRVNRDKEEAQRMGVSSTPMFFINDIRVSGAQPFSVFRQSIEAALA